MATPSFSVDSQRAFALLDKIGFVRMAGTPQESRAADMIAAELADAGLTARLETFDIPDAEECSATLEVLEPYRASYAVTAYKCSANTPDAGLEGDFLYVEDASEADLLHARGKIVLVNGYLRLPLYRKLLQAGVAAFITMSGDVRDTPQDSDLFNRMLREPLLRQGDPLPGANLRIADAMELVRRRAARVRLAVHSRPVQRTSRNVTAEVPGTDGGREFLTLTAHYDSVEFSNGVYDNGAGSVILLELARWFAAHPPRRTLRFVWCGSEEIGLEGSKAYVRDHADELTDCRFLLNVDVGAPVLGHDVVRLTAAESVQAFTDCFMKLRGYGVQVERGIYSSDNMPFADADIPAASFAREAAPGGGYIHCRYDRMDWLSADALGKTALQMLDYTDTLANAVIFPFERLVPEDMHQQIDRYFYKKELEEAREAAEKRAAEANG